ncbi:MULTISPECIES: septum formation initiator [Dethiosulfovibrio]|uniref:Septum formation initiator n=2 Tax=Dethiosulfovibrio TaxID=47054 RepID=A0ABS9EKJ3_9BACT|nr:MULTISPECIES: septum formation initiator [Dethiosulfovibrio]MCF4113861.1 septum formation initiator [Dethiosulfovibrio russensis]MCF4141726.1 septum formation initiator [Dethiosulfovibrio marinus]MCF4143857.1 septum formation initiator [Dethiosulfovibrio acidaminovorans]MEA3284037.1 septum formation initiator [Synergistota bacterium]
MPRLRWILFWAMVALFFAVFSTAMIRERRRVAELSQAVSIKEDELRKLSDDLERSRQKLEFYGTDKGKARLARDQFNLVFPGERIYRLSVESDDVLPESGR